MHGIVASGKVHTCSSPSLSSLHRVTIETVSLSVWLNSDRSRRGRVEHRLLPFSTTLSLRRSLLYCSGLTLLENVPNFSATLPCQTVAQTYVSYTQTKLGSYSNRARKLVSLHEHVSVQVTWACLCAIYLYKTCCLAPLAKTLFC